MPFGWRVSTGVARFVDLSVRRRSSVDGTCDRTPRGRDPRAEPPPARPRPGKTRRPRHPVVLLSAGLRVLAERRAGRGAAVHRPCGRRGAGRSRRAARRTPRTPRTATPCAAWPGRRPGCRRGVRTDGTAARRRRSRAPPSDPRPPPPGRGARGPVTRGARHRRGQPSAGCSLSEMLLMQYRWSVGVGYPSPSNTCPRCEPQRAQRTSVRTMPWERSSTSSTASVSFGS